MPRAETPTHYITFGLDTDLDDAARQALKEMIDWIVSMTGIHKDEAYAMCSFAGDLHVTQTVNNVKGVHAMLQKSISEEVACAAASARYCIDRTGSRLLFRVSGESSCQASFDFRMSRFVTMTKRQRSRCTGQASKSSKANSSPSLGRPVVENRR